MAKLYFRYGAMGCGKTMQLLQVAFNYEERGHRVCVMKPKTDTKNGEKLLTRIGPERVTDFCFEKTDDLFEIVEKLQKKKKKKISCVLVDEAQFLTREKVRLGFCRWRMTLMKLKRFVNVEEKLHSMQDS